MPHSRRDIRGCTFGLWIALSLCFATGHPAQSADPVIEPENLRRGLVATYRDAAKPTPAEVMRLEPGIALALKAGEAAHPRLRVDGGSVLWQGYVNVLRRGAYRFQVRLRGRFLLRVAGKEVLAAEVTDERPALKESADVLLEAGVHPLAAEFTRLPGDARVELFWESKHFRREPLPYDHLGHLADKTPARLTADALIERGRYLVEESACVRCHHSAKENPIAKGFVSRSGPDLSNVGRRARPAWLMRWLESPQHLRPGAAMPEMFSADEAGRVERFAVTRYLVSLGGPLRETPRRPRQGERQGSATRGERLFGSLGCIACHGSPADDKAKPKEDIAPSFVFVAPVRIYPLTGLADKTTAEQLAVYLKNPLTVDPSGRMPHMLLQDREAEDLALFLCQTGAEKVPDELPKPPSVEQMLDAFRRVDNRAEELAAFEKRKPNEQWVDLGKRLVIDKGCNNCHTIAPGGKPFASMQANASLEDLMQPPKQDTGCLAREPNKRGKAPRFRFAVKDRTALKAFLREGLTGAGSPAPAYAARNDIERFNCLACHSRDGDGGLSAATLEQLRRYENAENAEAVTPPPLTGAGHKLLTSWVRQVFLSGGRARPWMGLRMPQFGEANVGRLPEALAALEGTEPDDTVHKTTLTAAKIESGRYLAGKNAFGCISCHDIAGIANRGTRGPDLALMNQRVRHDWYRRWLEQPQRIQPGTRMPAVFMDGKSLLEKVLGGSAEAQADALWGYLTLGPGLPLPDGMEPPQGLIVIVKDRPVLLRTFMPDAGSRAVAIGFPGGVSAVFDAHTCRLAYAWSGNFLDASPAWNDRGGNPAKVLGTRIWNAPPGCPVGATTSPEPPDFANRAKDPAYGGRLPEGKLYDGPALLQFDGYATDKQGVPTFRYHLQTGTDEKLTVSERVESLRSPAAVGVERHFRIRAGSGQVVWLLAGETNGTPRLLDDRGTPVSLDLKSGKIDVSITDRMLVLPQGVERVVVLSLPVTPKGSQWHLERRERRWQVLLQVPAQGQRGEIVLDLNVWAPYRDEPALLRELTSRK
jgi:cbb3-type cytochrome oxidase cytochrome c subunit